MKNVRIACGTITVEGAFGHISKRKFCEVGRLNEITFFFLFSTLLLPPKERFLGYPLYCMFRNLAFWRSLIGSPQFFLTYQTPAKQVANVSSEAMWRGHRWYVNFTKVIFRPIKCLKLIGSWFLERSTNFSSVVSGENNGICSFGLLPLQYLHCLLWDGRAWTCCSNNRLRCANVPGIRLPFNFNL